ncbi:E3 ubiquitin-protein ligase listerin [Planococcus citri]|uniref:E3 ubiquitin-protein ligase listerin n=1 Tax=Planococcus citri TaxID=170843 RepID=UPI0031F83BE9
MGGKQKQAQRTKNNARPSNSGRSAELLGNSTGKLFSALKDNANYVAPVSNIDSDANINHDFQLVMKKMNKKDPVTRQKALQEFVDLCQTSDLATVKSILPFWPRLYNSLAVDSDYRVREAAQQAHRVFVLAVKRDIAPYLKQLIGAWFVSPFDSHPLAASVAKSSFQAAFSPSKRTEVIVFAHKEILQYISQNIIHETPESFAGSKSIPADELNIKYQRILSANLLGYAQYLEKIPKEQLIEALQDNKTMILNTNKFWKFAKDESKSVKAAWFTAVLALINKAPFLLENNYKKLCTSIFSNFDENDSNVLPLVWDAALSSSTIVSNWWEHVSPDKLVFPKMWRVLQEAAFGNASIIFPSLLPLLSRIQIPQNIKIEDFHSKLFTSLLTGLSNTRAQRSTSETEAVVNTYFECLCYVIKKNIENREFCLSLVDNVLVLLIDKSLNDKSLFASSSSVFLHLSVLLRYWGRMRNSADKIYEALVDSIWLSLRSMVTRSVIAAKSNEDKDSENNSIKDDLEKKLRVHQKMVNALKNPTDVRQKKQTRVKFSSPAPEKNDSSQTSSPSEPEKPTNELTYHSSFLTNDAYFTRQLNDLVNDMIQVYYDAIQNSKYSYLFVNQLCNVLNLFSEKCYYQKLTEIVHATCTNNSSEDNESSELINNVMRSWLSDNRVSVDAVLNVLFHLLVYLKDDEKVVILNNISEDHMSSMLELCLNLANDSQLQNSVRKWLSSAYFKSTLNKFAHEVSKTYPPSMEKVNILKTCFKAPKNGESYTNEETKLEILKVFRDSLLHDTVSAANSHPQQPHKANLSCIAKVLKEVFKEYNYPLLRKNHAVITSTIGYLFLYGCDVDNHVDDDDVLNESWVLGVQTLARIFGCTSPDFINVTEQFAFAVIELVEKSKCKIEDMKHIINFVCTYIECLPMSLEVDKSSNTEESHRHMYDDEVLDATSATYADITSLICEVFLKIAVQYCHANMETSVVNACLKAEFYNGSMTCRLSSNAEESADDIIFGIENKAENDINECFASVAKLFNVAYYIVTVINNYLLDEIYPKKEDEEDDTKKDTYEPFLSKHGLGKLNESVVYVIYLLAVLKSFNENFKHARFYDHITENNLTELESITSAIVKMHPRSPILLLKLAIMNKAFQCGGFWAKALFILFVELMEGGNVNEAYHEIIKCHDVSDYRVKSYILHISELFAKVAQFRMELYSPDAKLDEEKLSVLTCFLRANKENKFSSDQDRVIWYWLDTILIHKKQLESTFNKNLMECKPSEIMLAATVCRFLSVVSDGKIPLMTDKRTDFMMIALASWMQSIHKTCSSASYEENPHYNLPMCIFISAVCDMFKSMTKLASNVTYSDKLFIEWNNVFAAETHTIISYNWKNLAESEGCRNVEQFLVLNTLSGLIITHVDFIQFVVRPDLNFWLCACSDLIQSYCAPVRLAAYYVLVELSLEMVGQDSCVSVVEDMEEKLTLEILSISSLQTIVNIVLSSYKNGDERVLDPNTDSYVYVHSYLLVWMVVIKMCENAPVQVRYRYASWLKDEGYLEMFLHNLQTLMPEKVHKNNLSDAVVKKIRELFSIEPRFTLEDRWDTAKLTMLVCRLYYMSLWLLPAFVRQWWKSMDSKEATVVDKLTTRFVSPTLIMEEMKAIKKENNVEKFSMKGYPATRQIIASYTVEDATMEITMQLAANHPLGFVKVDSSNVVLLSNRWRTWAKQLNMYLAHQNGLIRDGIMSWKSNVDKAFEGVEECYICFSIVHSSNYQLPKQSCKTCHKKFHPLCLYRWFITSNKSSCPICRNHF